MTGCVTYLCTGVALCSVMYICVYCILGILFQQSLVSSQMKIDKIFLGLWNLLSGCVWSPPSTLYSGRSLLKPIPGSRFLSRTHMYLNFENCTFRLQISFYSLKYLTMIVLNFDNIQSLRQYKGMSVSQSHVSVHILRFESYSNILSLFSFLSQINYFFLLSR